MQSGMTCSGICRATVGRYGTGRWRKPSLRPQSPPPVATGVGEPGERDLVFNHLLSGYDLSGRGSFGSGCPSRGFGGGGPGSPRVRWAKRKKKVLCASLTLPSAKQGQQPTSQHTWHRYREAVYTSVHLVTSSMFTQDLHSYLCDHEAIRGQSLPNCFILGGGDRLGKGILVHEISPQ